MALSVGDTIPNVQVTTPTLEGLKPVQTGDVLGTGKVVLFAVPGAFTPTCSDHHLPASSCRPTRSWPRAWTGSPASQ